MKSPCLVQVQALARRPRVLKNVMMMSVPPSNTSLARVFSVRVAVLT